MKKFLLRIAIFFAILFIIDRVAGYTFSYMSKHSKGGYVGHHNYITDGVHEDILIFGSSRAIHHYNPQILVDSLGLSCYNCGQDGNGILLYYGWWQIIKEHYKPKIIIYDIATSFDLHVGEDNHKYLGWLKESYERANIREIFDAVDKTEKYKMMSQMYRYNSKFHQIAADFVYPLYVVKANGFLPLQGEVDTMRIKKKNDSAPVKKAKFDPLKIEYLNKFIDETDSVKLIFTVSPMWYGINPEHLSAIKDICQQRDIPFVDFSNDPKYVHNNVYFKDGSHLNARGADEFTRDLIRELKNRGIMN
mgnify:FL=1